LTKALHAYAKEQLALDALRDKPKASETVAVAENALRAHLLTSALNATISLEGAFPAIVSGRETAPKAFAIDRFVPGSSTLKSTVRASRNSG
jgi:hypothetical protein